MLEKINKQIDELETLYRLQKENANFYFHHRKDDFLGYEWEETAKKTKEEVEQLKQERAVLEKWSKAE